ncbi:4168_t:CDS:1, partial [Paraglomus brasilianum]
FHHPRQLTEFRIIQEQPELAGQQAETGPKTDSTRVSDTNTRIDSSIGLYYLQKDFVTCSDKDWIFARFSSK